MAQLSVTGWMFVAAVAMAMVGTFLLWRGWRGKRIDDHPLCRKCGFDLFGRPKGSTRCPECGAALYRTTVMIGHRQRVWSFISAGTATALISVSLIGVVSVREISRANLRPYKPLWFVLREARSSSAPTRHAAVVELTRRVTKGKVSRSDIPKVADAALLVQQRLDWPWEIEWGNLLEWLRAQDLLTNDQWARYAQQAAVDFVSFQFPAHVRHGEDVKYTILYRGGRTGARGLQWYIYETTISADGVELPYRWKSGFAGGSLGSQSPGSTEESTYGAYMFEQLSSGPHAGTIRFRIMVNERRIDLEMLLGRGSFRNSAVAKAEKAAIAKTELTLPFSFTMD